MNIQNLNKIPHLPGVYIFKDRYDKVIYIGKAKDLKNRVSSYFFAKSDFSFKISGIRLLTFKIDFIICDSDREALIAERRLISEFKPFFNVLWKDSKRYPYIVITKEDFPRLLITRNMKIKGKYFGPYPKAEIIKKLIEKLRDIKIINLRFCNYEFSLAKPLDRKKIDRCVYYHTGQCPSPCDCERISIKKYNDIVKNSLDFFSGRYDKIKAYFLKKMKESSDILDYENAKIYRDAIKAIDHINERVTIKETDIKEIESKADFTKTLIGLKEKLNLNKIPYHIESFDISNLLNRYAVCGMVCFINGKKNHSHYRRYKINFVSEKGSNDYAMIYEAVKRRVAEIKRNDNSPPDLFLIDGGKGQLLSALKALKEGGLKSDIISLAKENEEIYKIDFKNCIILEKDSPELLFLMAVRDETHRFALSYHKKLRSRGFLFDFDRKFR
ncbi:MAG: GIY-YIG nuclease family protein [Elusimicrobiales bacterium]